MVGFPKRKRDLHKKRIKSWFDAVIHDGGIDRFDELHVDVIDKKRKSKKSWISAALESFEIALEIRDADTSGQELTIILSFALVDDVRPMGITFHDRESLEKNLSYSPPCILVYRKSNDVLKKWKSLGYEEASELSMLKTLNTKQLFGELRRLQDVFIQNIYDLMTMNITGIFFSSNWNNHVLLNTEGYGHYRLRKNSMIWDKLRFVASFVTGHGFSRAANATGRWWALAPAGGCFQSMTILQRLKPRF